MRLGYVVHNLNDPAVERRCDMFERGGAKVALAGFCRDENLSEAIAGRRPLELGASADAAMIARVIATARTAMFNRRLVDFLAGCDAIVARNLEQLAIARRLIGNRPLVYECLDIHRLLVGSGAAARLVQRAEGALLPRVDMLITSSPAFVRNHFAQSRLNAPALLVENKVLAGKTLPPAAAPRTPQWPVTIGWFGMLRCRRTLDFLTGLVEKSDGRIEVLVAGKPSPAELPDLETRIAKTPHMRFAGPYRYEDLPALYSQCHFAWAIDWFEEGLNSKWLLPNRLYEPLLHGVIPIALADVEVGRWLAASGAGMLVENAEEAAKRLMALDFGALASMQDAVLSIDRGRLAATDKDCRALVEEIAAL